MLTRKKIAVLRGGPSSEYQVSLQTGAAVLNSLSDEKYDIFDVAITQAGDWYLKGARVIPADLLSQIDLVFNALHGEYGEDGKVQRILEQSGIPYTGSNPLSSALAMNKILAKREFKKAGLKIPVDFIADKKIFEQAGNKLVAEIFQTCPMPAIVKPACAGSSVGVSVARDMVELEQALRVAFEISNKVLVEEFIAGREASCGVIDNFRSASEEDGIENLYALLPIEIRPKSDGSFFDYEAKYSGESEEICPGEFSDAEKEELQNLARHAHQVLGLRHYSRSDFIVTPRRGIYLLETNSLPGLTQNSLFPKSLRAIGSDLPEFIEHLIKMLQN